MPKLLLILLKINLVLLLFAAAYYFALRRLTFYKVNRVFLILGIIFSTIYPFIDLSDFFYRQKEVNANVVAMVSQMDMNALLQYIATQNYWQGVIILFYAGTALMAIRLIIQLLSLYSIHRTSAPALVKGLKVRILNAQLSPFSFWQTIYINPELHEAEELETILAHEQIHVKQWHTLDILLAELSVVFYWFNPGVWLMKRAIKENIEFITDADIVNMGVDKKTYQYSLLGVGSLRPGNALVNHFNLWDLKRRIKMMNARRSSPKKLIIYALILPTLLLLTLAFTVTRKEVKQQLIPVKKALMVINLLADKSNADSSKNTESEIVIKKKVNFKFQLPDSVKRQTFTIKYNYSDSTGQAINDNQIMVTSLEESNIEKIRISKVDSLLAAGKPNRIINVVVGHKTSLPPTKETSNEDKLKAIVVKGYARGVRINDSGKRVQLYEGRSSATESAKMQPVAYFVNGKKVNLEELKKVDSKLVEGIDISKNQTSGEIRLTTKGQ